MTIQERLAKIRFFKVTPDLSSLSGDERKVYEYTSKGNMVAVVTDGSAVLGLGNIGPEAALPVMEGKAILLKELAGMPFPFALIRKIQKKLLKLLH